MGILNSQDEQPISRCDSCGGEIYADELVHVIDGFIICAECFDDYVFDYFASNMVTGEDLREMLSEYDDD